MARKCQCSAYLDHMLFMPVPAWRTTDASKLDELMLTSITKNRA
ncbi:hypothetical protein ECW26_47840 [Escherichia coli W26]|nr:hypothetical protein ECW26_47840 [Escherichia coli W26]